MKNLQNFDIVVISGKTGLFFCTQTVKKFYDCGNGYQEDAGAVKAWDVKTGTHGDTLPIYRSDLKKVRLATDAELSI